MAILTVGVTALPNPAEYEVTYADLDSENTTRSETGVLTRDRIRADVPTISNVWRVSKTDLKIITDAIAAASFSCTFFDPTSSSNPTATFYAGNRKGKLLKLVEGDEANSRWELSCDFIEY
jgi:hypothetical protein